MATQERLKILLSWLDPATNDGRERTAHDAVHFPGEEGAPGCSNMARKPKTKRQKQESEPDNPLYGSQEYWETRYKTQIDGKSQETCPFHAWYFTFDELSPIILPIILGDEGDETSIADGSVASADDGALDNPPTQDADNEESAGSEDEDSVVYRKGLCTNGPIDIMEIGCGDVPLGADLALELLDMEDNRRLESLSDAVKSIVCTDYSTSVVKQMRDKYLTKNDDGELAIRHAPLSFVTADACNMSYMDETFDFVLEKGTLDAIISDKKHGRERAIRCIAECGRILRVGGFLLIVSHLNACNPEGVNWLETVVFPGLVQSKGNFRIEVHTSGDAMESETPGPAVYVMSKSEQDLAQKTIPVKIFTH